MFTNPPVKHTLIRRIVLVVLVAFSFMLTSCRQELGAAAGPNSSVDIQVAKLVTITPPEVQAGDLPETLPGEQTECPTAYFSLEDLSPQYRLDASINLKDHLIFVKEQILYPNTSTDWMDNIMLVVEPNRNKSVFSLTSIKLGPEPASVFSLKDGALELELSSPLPPGCALEVNLEFVLALPEQEGLFGYTDEQVVLTNWYPFIPPYISNQKWQAHPPARFGEHLVYPLADFDVTLEFAQEISNEMVAAPAVAVVKDGKLIYNLAQARTFSLAVLPGHRHISRAVDGTEFHVYFKQDSEAAAEAALDTLVSSVDVYEGLFGEYPFQSLTTAELSMFDGMEYDGIFFLGRDIFPAYDHTSKNIFTLLVAHETAHNWWFSQVANDQALEPWLDEALATYCELLYLEKVYPELIDWWWEFRVLDPDPVGPVDVSIYDYFDYESYRKAVYLRGALFFQAVRDQIGEEAFFALLEQYYFAGKGKIATADLFFSTIEQVSDQPIDLVRAKFFKSQ